MLRSYFKIYCRKILIVKVGSVTNKLPLMLIINTAQLTLSFKNATRKRSRRIIYVYYPQIIQLPSSSEQSAVNPSGVQINAPEAAAACHASNVSLRSVRYAAV